MSNLLKTGGTIRSRSAGISPWLWSNTKGFFRARLRGADSEIQANNQCTVVEEKAGY